MSPLNYAAPQFLVDDLPRAIKFYRDALGFNVDFIYENFYASVSRDGARIHLKCTSKLTEEQAFRKREEHLDAFIAVDAVRDLHGEFAKRGAKIVKPLETRPWGETDFYVEDPDGYILAFSEPAS